VPVAITGTDMVTCLGDAESTVAALLDGRSGAGPLRMGEPDKLGIAHGYPILDDGPERVGRASDWLAGCVATAVKRSDTDLSGARVAVIVGTGLRELRGAELWHSDGHPFARRKLHFGEAVRAVLPAAAEVWTVSNACAASGYALAFAADLLEQDEADAVVVAGADTMTESMLTMIGRVGAQPADRVQPFDAHRLGVLLGEGAVAVVLERDGADAAGRAVGRVLGVGVNCDARHETAPDRGGIVAAMRDAHARAGIAPDEVGLVLAHGTGTALNDPTEAAALSEVFAGTTPGPLVTGVKGSLGHTSGGAALMSTLVALEALRRGTVPPTVGLTEPIPEAADLRLVRGASAPTDATVAQVDGFGFGGVNAVAMVTL
jgi:3-oxoacyl-[acyl-carrier-protein] synthase II